jgi:ATP-binding cassette, subfamily B, bacterial
MGEAPAQEPAAVPEGTVADFTTSKTRFRRAAIEQHGVIREQGQPVETTWLPRLSRGILKNRFYWPGFPWPRRKVPVLIQSQVSDCGPACLAMVLAYHGLKVGIDGLRREMNCGRNGVSARALLDTARRYGVHGRGVRAGLSELRHLPPGTLLFWKFNHFVVLERATASYVDVVDPALGRRRIPTRTASGAFTGVALEFEPPAVVSGGSPRRWIKRPQANSWRYLTKFFPRHSTWIPVAAASLILLLFNFATPIASYYIVDQPARRSPGAGLDGFGGIAIALVAAYFLLQAVRSLAISSLQTISDKRITLGVLQHLLSLPYDYFVRRNAGDLAMRVRTSLAVRRVLTSSAISTVFDGLLIFVYGTLLTLADAQLALLVMMLALLQAAVVFGSWRHQHHLTATTLDCQAQSESELVELLDGIPTLKAAGLDSVAGERWAHTFADEVNARRRSLRFLAVCTSLSMSLQFSAPLAVLALGALQIGWRTASLGEVVGFSALAMGLFVPLANLVQTGLQVAGLGRTLSRLGDILQAEPEDRALEAMPQQAISGRVEVRSARFTYPGNSAEALSGVTLTAVAGSFIAVVGESGCGKSTLAGLVAALYTPTGGQVLIDGSDTRRIDRVALRRSISFVNQNARLFAGSIGDNIAAGHMAATFNDIVTAADLAGIHADIERLPMRYETMLGPDGAGLSGGQRQRIALARALVRKPRLIILDEATSAVDMETEERIFQRILRLDATVIVVTHRLAAASAADQIIVLDGGKVVQRGRHDELIAEDSAYRALARGTRHEEHPGLQLP